MNEFERVTAIQPRGDDGYAVELDSGWCIGGKPNGGYLLAVLARAACDAVDAPAPLAVSGHFLRAPDPGPAEVRIEVVRRGRRVSTVRSSVWQRDKPCLDALVSAGPLEGGTTEWVADEPPAMPAPEQCPDRPPDSFRVELLDHVELRVDPSTSPFPHPTGEPVVRGWFRLGPDIAPDPLSLLVAVDAMPPTVFNLDRVGWAPTVELTVLLRGVPAPGWLRCEARTSLVAGGWFDEQASVWDSTGRLVAQSRQLALAGS